MIKNVQYEYSDNGELYGYLNLDNDYHKVSVYFPTAFYNEEHSEKEKLIKFMDILKKEIKEKKAMVVCFGEIRYKKIRKKDLIFMLLIRCI